MRTHVFTYTIIMLAISTEALAEPDVQADAEKQVAAPAQDVAAVENEADEPAAPVQEGERQVEEPSVPETLAPEPKAVPEPEAIPAEDEVMTARERKRARAPIPPTHAPPQPKVRSREIREIAGKTVFPLPWYVDVQAGTFLQGHNRFSSPGLQGATYVGLDARVRVAGHIRNNFYMGGEIGASIARGNMFLGESWPKSRPRDLTAAIQFSGIPVQGIEPYGQVGGIFSRQRIEPTGSAELALDQYIESRSLTGGVFGRLGMMFYLPPAMISKRKVSHIVPGFDIGLSYKYYFPFDAEFNQRSYSDGDNNIKGIPVHVPPLNDIVDTGITVHLGMFIRMF